MTNQDTSSNYLQSCTNRNGLLYQYYNSEDMEQIIINPRKEDIDPSIKCLTKRKRRMRMSSHCGQIVASNGKRFHYIPVYPQLDKEGNHGEIQDYDSFKKRRKREKQEEDQEKKYPFEISSMESDCVSPNYRMYLRKLRMNHLDNIDYWLRPQSYDSMHFGKNGEQN